ncbi:hypothetical protein [Vibrio metoecus]|uniref:hypothetical protein n=1 Tax=Vibrio metoecus TaxID=1481663 RepID=UPI00215C00F9|nr:hypothetical protein [Vibrio metoecus]MCR9386221.1 hypothetical protein [Vibrio metoecus]
MILLPKNDVRFYKNSLMQFVLVCSLEQQSDLQSFYIVEPIAESEAQELINNGYGVTFVSGSAEVVPSITLN